LRSLLRSDGNLGAHLEKLERAGYIEIRKLFQGKKPRTEILATVQGRSAFASHTAALRKIIGEML
jgi:DNA-binding MarR family transcriptional regulator